MERGRALGKSNVKDVILVAKHESGANIKEVNMFGGVGVGTGQFRFKVVPDYTMHARRRSECFRETVGLFICFISVAREPQSCSLSPADDCCPAG